MAPASNVKYFFIRLYILLFFYFFIWGCVRWAAGLTAVAVVFFSLTFALRQGWGQNPFGN
jgi:hypothetical protein